MEMRLVGKDDVLNLTYRCVVKIHSAQSFHIFPLVSYVNWISWETGAVIDDNENDKNDDRNGRPI